MCYSIRSVDCDSRSVKNSASVFKSKFFAIRIAFNARIKPLQHENIPIDVTAFWIVVFYRAHTMWFCFSLFLYNSTEIAKQKILIHILIHLHKRTHTTDSLTLTHSRQTTWFCRIRIYESFCGAYNATQTKQSGSRELTRATEKEREIEFSTSVYSAHQTMHSGPPTKWLQLHKSGNHSVQRNRIE